MNASSETSNLRDEKAAGNAVIMVETVIPPHNNWAVLACTSSYWFNYRHLSNVLSLYFVIRRLGIPDDHIILMNTLDSTCDTRNPFPGDMYNEVDSTTVLGGSSLEDSSVSSPPCRFGSDNSRNNLTMAVLNRAVQHLNLNGDIHVDLDYRGEEVGVDSFLRLLTGRHAASTPWSKRLRTDENSNILIFLSGHGGDEFFKFRDTEEMSTQDLGYAFHDMFMQKRYKEILLLVDTCQAATIANAIEAPRVITIGSSRKGENSYSYDSDQRLGVAVIDRFSHSLNMFFRSAVGVIAGNHEGGVGTSSSTVSTTSSGTSSRGSGSENGGTSDTCSNGRSSNDQQVINRLHALTLQDLLDGMNPHFLYSRVGVHLSPEARQPKDIPLIDFFGHLGHAYDPRDPHDDGDRSGRARDTTPVGLVGSVEVMTEGGKGRLDEEVNTSGASPTPVLSFRDPSISAMNDEHDLPFVRHPPLHPPLQRHRHENHQHRQWYHGDLPFRHKIFQHHTSASTIQELSSYSYQLFLLCTLLAGYIYVRRGHHFMVFK